MKTEFNNEQKLAIAEFVFSNGSDILIKSDGMAIVKVLREVKIITDEKAVELEKDIQNNSGNPVAEIGEVLKKKIPKAQGDALMQEYYAGKL